MPKLLTAKEAAEMLNVNVFTLYKMGRERVIPSIRLGKRIVRFNEENLRRWIFKNTIKERQADEQ